MALVKYNDRSIRDLTTTPTAAGGGDTGAIVHIKTLTASTSATLSFVDGADDVVLDSTYPIYKFEFINIHPGTNDSGFMFNGSIDAGSNYNVTKTSTFFYTYHNEGDSAAGVAYNTGHDLAQGTGDQKLAHGVGNGNDENVIGNLTLFNPSSTTFVKHFIANTSLNDQGDYAISNYSAGYFNTTSDIDAIIFKMDSGNIDSGKIKLYGIKDA